MTAAERAAALDAADPLGSFPARFLSSPDVVAYLDGNSLGRPPAAAAERLAVFVRDEWAGALIRGWTGDGPHRFAAGPWMEWPGRIGDRIAEVALGAAPGTAVLADSTTVLLYKLARAAVDAAGPERREIIACTDDFPTDRYVVEGIAGERGCTVVWAADVEQAAALAGPRTALVVASHVNYNSAVLADGAAVTAAVHAAGARILWDLSHSVGAVPLDLAGWGADLAVGCTYKFLCGGPGAPAFGYVRPNLQETLRQPVQGWMGRADPFAMAAGYRPAGGIRQVVSGTPPILGAVPLLAGLDLLAEAGIDAVRAKSVALTGFAVELVDEWLGPLGVELISPRDAALRGGHVTIRRPGFRAVCDQLWARGVLPDYREPDGIRLGLSPLSTTFAEVHRGLDVLRELLTAG